MKYRNASIIIILMAFFQSCSDSESVRLSFDENSTVITYGINKLVNLLDQSGYVIDKDESDHLADHELFVIYPGLDSNSKIQDEIYDQIGDLHSDGFKIVTQDRKIYVLGGSERGCQYGILHISDQMRNDPDINHLIEYEVNPVLSFRAIKFNLPWAPYRPGPATEIHKETCRDLKYWESFLDMMVDNRFNALSLWSNHLFPYMIKATNYPEATPFNDMELEEWRSFWKALFKMARDRGIETYLVNWNIVVSPDFAQNYGAKLYDDRSDLVVKYTRESITQLINEYEDLTGLGVTLADWMGNWGADQMTPKEREDWIEATFVEGMKKASRKVKFIHRAVLAGDPKEMRRVIDHADLPERSIVEVKFNWSHAYSTPKLSITHANNEGTIMRDFWDPVPENYFIAWMIRNEDFFVLRWGNPEFIRKHIQVNNHDYVDGYFIGSEGYIPALDYSHMDHPHKTWDYAFEKQWMYYYLWGHLLYDPFKTDSSIAESIHNRYKDIDPYKFLNAYTLASEVPTYIASFYKGTWDFTLYSEGFLAPWQYGFDDGKSPFISLEELIKHETLDSRMLSITNFCQNYENGQEKNSNFVTPLELADDIQNTCSEAMVIIDEFKSPADPSTLDSELDDLATWCYLGFYFADKIRAGISAELFKLYGDPQEKEKALRYLELCIEHWNRVIHLTENRYKPMPYVSMGHHEPRWPEFKTFHWKNFLNDVKEDVAYVNNLQ